jgi:hypothetical protein
VSYSGFIGTKVFNFATSYTPPAGNAVNFNFDPAFGETQYIMPQGFDALQAGWAPYVSWRQYILPAGIDATEFGSIERFYERFTYNHNFVDAYTPPTGSAVNHNFSSALTILPGGLDALAIGSHTLQTTPAIRPAGIDGAAFGSTTVWKQQFIVPAGLDATAFGTTVVENQNRYFSFTGFDASAFGTAALTRTNYPQTLTTTGDDHARVGVHVVTRGLQIEPAGFDAAAVGDQAVSNYLRTLYHEWEGIDTAELGTPEVSNYHRELLVGGWDSNEFGVTEVRGYGVFTSGFSTAAIGDHTVANFRQFIEPSGINGVEFSTSPDYHSISNWIRYIQPAGINGAAFGTHRVENFIRYLPPAGIAPLALGTQHMVSHRIRTIYPVGDDFAFVWNDYGPIDPVTGRAASVYNETQYLAPAGINAGVFGLPQAARQQLSGDWTLRTRFGDYWGIEGAGAIDAAAFGTTVITTGAATLSPSGFDAAAFGATLVRPAIRAAGIDGAEFGATLVRPAIRAAGIDGAEFGTAQINQRISATGFDAAAVGTPLLSGTIAPAGFDSLDMGADYDAENYDSETYNDRNRATTVSHA